MGMTDSEMDAHDRLTGIIATLANLPSTNVVLVGDIMMDRYIHGFADNLNTRAPVPVLKETRREEAVGAAAHVARGLVSLGLNPCHPRRWMRCMTWRVNKWTEPLRSFFLIMGRAW